jgi:Na+/H+-translocating membrane pyrophosphatase
MRRRLNCAYLAQYFLMLVVVVLLVLLAWRGAAGYIFALVFLIGIIAAALPGFYSGYVLPRRERQRAEKILKSGSPAQAQVLQDGETILAEFQRTTLGYKGVSLLLDVPVLIQPAEQKNAHQASMKVEINSLQRLKSGALVSVRCDPEDLQYVVMDDLLPDQP